MLKTKQALEQTQLKIYQDFEPQDAYPTMLISNTLISFLIVVTWVENNEKNDEET